MRACRRRSTGEDRRTGYVRIDVIKLDDTIERHRKVLIGDVLRADERPEQGDRVEDDARDAEVHVPVGSVRDRFSTLSRARRRRSGRAGKIKV